MDKENVLKSGIHTTEFWMTLVAQIVPILALVNVIPADDIDSVTKAITALISGLIGVGAAIAYIWSRVQLKKKALEIQGTRV